MDQWRIDNMIKNMGIKTSLQLAKIHNCHYKTVEYHWKVWKDSQPPLPGQLTLDGKEELQGYNIKVISVTPGKTLNFKNVTQIVRDKDFIHIMSGEDKIGMLVPENVTAIIPMEG